MRRWFRRSNDGSGAPARQGERNRFNRLPARVDTKKTHASHPATAPRDPEGGRDTDRDFIIRYGDPFDDG